MAVYGYIRVSTDEQVTGTSLDEQRRQITGLAMTVGLALDNSCPIPASRARCCCSSAPAAAGLRLWRPATS
jgi:hypothetical protein